MASVAIKPAYDDLDVVRELFSEYVALLGLELGFQDYDAEFAGLPGKYAPPFGRLYLAWFDDSPCGCIALRRFDAGRCEMKRMYVRPEFRGQGIGGALVRTLIDDARAIGYAEMILDSFLYMESAIVLYRKLGFAEIAPYYENPYPDVVYLSLLLDG